MNIRFRLWTLTRFVIGFALGGTAESVSGQTDFYHLDKDRPLRVEDAFSAKHRVFEIQISPLHLSQSADGEVQSGPSVEFKYGLLPGVETSIGLALAGNPTSIPSFGEVEGSALVNLWVEGEHLPAAALRGSGHVDHHEGTSFLELRGILTRSLRGPVRAHLNAGWRFGAGEEVGPTWAAMAFDYVLPFRHILLLGEGGWEAAGREVEGAVSVLHTGVGARIQLTPTWVLDAGTGRVWRGTDRKEGRLTLGLTREFGLRNRSSGSPQ